MVAGGCALATSFLLRVFPVAIWCGIILRAGVARNFDTGGWTATPSGMAGGALLTVGILFPASLWTTGGIPTYREFVTNSAKHVGTPLVNHMGLATLFRGIQT